MTYTPCKAEQPLQGMKLQQEQKQEQKCTLMLMLYMLQVHLRTNTLIQPLNMLFCVSLSILLLMVVFLLPSSCYI